jgi:hypothetical protein
MAAAVADHDRLAGDHPIEHRGKTGFQLANSEALHRCGLGAEGSSLRNDPQLVKWSRN